MATPCPKVYAPRKPQTTALYQVVAENRDLFLEVYSEELCANYGPLRDTARRALEKYLTCGLLRYGFARARCPSCPHEFLVAFSCQKRGVCPSCAAKRVELFCDFAHRQVIQAVAHRQFVFVLPKRFRLFFQGHAKMMTKLCRAMAESLRLWFQKGLALPDVRPGVIACIQTFGDGLNAHTHLHVLVTEGGFRGDSFYPFAWTGEDLQVLQKIFAGKIFSLLLQTKKITPWIKEQMSTWRHSGFSIDASVRVAPNDQLGLFRVLRYMARAPIAKDRLLYDRLSGQVTLLGAKDQAKIVGSFSALELLARLCLHVPPKGSHLIRYYGYYASRCRFLRGKNAAVTLTQRPNDTPTKKERRKRWAELLRQVFEINPLTCPKCKHEMRIVAFVLGQAIEKNLAALGLAPEEELPRGPPRWLQMRQAKEWMDENQALYPAEEDLPQEAPSTDHYATDPVFAD